MTSKVNFLHFLSDKFLDLIYSPNKKYARYLLLLTFIGLVLRGIAALNLDFLADDAVYASQSVGVLSSGIISTHSNPPLFFYLNDLIFNLIGHSTLAARFIPLIAGTMLIPLIFLLVSKFFDHKVALAAAFFVTFSNFLVRMTFTEHSLLVFFLIFSGVNYGIDYLHKKSLIFLVLSSILFGLALLTKYNTPFFIVAFLIFSAYLLKTKKEIIFTKKNFKILVLSFSIIFLFSIPFLAFNYIIYKEQGLVDVYFSRVLNVEKAQQLYQGLAGQERSFFDNLLIPSNYGNYSLIAHTDFLMLIFAIGGFTISVIKKKKIFLFFLIIFTILPFLLQSAGSPLPKHFSFIFLLFSMPAGLALATILNKIKSRGVIILSVTLLAALMISLIGNQYTTPASYPSQSATSQLKSYLYDNADSGDLVILDARIYSARGLWLASPNNFIFTNQFPELYNLNTQVPVQTLVPTEVYLIECTIDDCGWGWVKDDQQVNLSNENIISLLKQNSLTTHSIMGKISNGNEFFNSDKAEIYTVHKLVLNLNPSILTQVSISQSFYFVPYMYKNLGAYIFNYDKTGINNLLHLLSLLIIYLAMILVILSFIIPILSL